MKKIHICLFLSVCFLTACSGSGNSQSSPEPSIAAEIQQETHGEQTTPTGIPEHMGVQDNKEEKPMRIQIESETVTILCELNDSQAGCGSGCPTAADHRSGKFQHQRKNILSARKAGYFRCTAGKCGEGNAGLLFAVGRRCSVLRSFRTRKPTL